MCILNKFKFELRELLGTLGLSNKRLISVQGQQYGLCTDSILDSANYAGNHKKMGFCFGISPQVRRTYWKESIPEQTITLSLRDQP